MCAKIGLFLQKRADFDFLQFLYFSYLLSCKIYKINFYFVNISINGLFPPFNKVSFCKKIGTKNWHKKQNIRLA